MHTKLKSVARHAQLRRLVPVVVLAAMVPARGVLADVVNGNFESGDTLFSSEYSPTDYLCTNGGGGPGSYLLGTNPASVNCYGDWASFGDHTSGSGLMMIVDGATDSNTVIWSETVKVSPGTKYIFTYWATSVNANGYGAAGDIQVYINGKPKGSDFQIPAAYDGWHQVNVNWKSGLATQATIWLVDVNTSGSWNDFALDDLSLTLK